jgi:hypothetical protein
VSASPSASGATAIHACSPVTSSTICDAWDGNFLDYTAIRDGGLPGGDAGSVSAMP